MPGSEPGVVIAFAGRRIDAPDAEVARFPASRVDAAEARLEQVIRERGAVALVSSAACGADLVALAVAERLGKPQQYVSRYETGERRLDIFEFMDVAAALEIDAIALIRAGAKFL